MPANERPGLVSVTIITDGYENASQEYSWSAVREMIKEQREKYSWVISFIGANIDVDKVSGDLGIDAKLSKKFTASKTGAASVFRSMSKGTTMMRSMSEQPMACMNAMAEAMEEIV